MDTPSNLHFIQVCIFILFENINDTHIIMQTKTKKDIHMYHKPSNIKHILVGNKIVDQSDVVGASPVRAAPTTSSFVT